MRAEPWALRSLSAALVCGLWWSLPHPQLTRRPLPRLKSAPLKLPTPHRVTHPALDELSGLTQSRLNPEVLWAHNDSLDRARLFALNRRGELLGEHPVIGAQNIDWEDMAAGDGPWSGLLFVADSGNNFHWRDELKVYVIREPSEPGGGAPLQVIASLSYRFPQQRRLPPLQSAERCLDAEALFWAQGGLYLIAKCFWGGEAPLYRFPLSQELLSALAERRSLDPTPPLILEELARLQQGISSPPFAWRVTAADYLPAREELLVLSYFGLASYSWRGSPTGEALHPRQLWRFEGRAKQVEALAWIQGGEGEPQIVLANEQRALWTLRLDHELRRP